MKKTRYSIPNISCGHCVMAIKRELGAMAGVSSVEGDPGSKSIMVEWDAPATEEKIKTALKGIHYPVAG